MMANVDEGVDAIASSVLMSAPPNPTANSMVPEAFTRAADAIAVSSLPLIVCSPSDSTIITCGAPLRTFEAASVDSPVSTPPDRYVQPPADKLLIAELSCDLVYVSSCSTLALVANLVMLTRVARLPSVNWSMIEFANTFSSSIELDMLPDTSSTSDSSKNVAHPGGLGGDGAAGGAGGGDGG